MAHIRYIEIMCEKMICFNSSNTIPTNTMFFEADKIHAILNKTTDIEVISLYTFRQTNTFYTDTDDRRHNKFYIVVEWRILYNKQTDEYMLQRNNLYDRQITTCMLSADNVCKTPDKYTFLNPNKIGINSFMLLEIYEWLQFLEDHGWTHPAVNEWIESNNGVLLK